MNGPLNTTYFTDRDPGRQFPQALRAAGRKVERHDDHFTPLTQDEELPPSLDAATRQP